MRMFSIVGALIGALIGIVLLVSRLLHGYSLSFTERFRFGRTWGAGLTFAVLGVSGFLCLLQAFRGMAAT